MKLYCMSVNKSNKTTAGAKAPDDIVKIAVGQGAKEIPFAPAHKFKNIKLTRFFSLFVGVRNWLNLFLRAEPNSYIIIQHPNENILVANKAINILKKLKGYKFIFLIHDMESLRKNIANQCDGLPEERGIIADEVLMKKADYIIAHNQIMRRYLVERGFEDSKIVDLEIFDYLHESQLKAERKRETSVIIAGNLVKEKAGYLYKLIQQQNLNFSLNLFGPNYTGPTEHNNIHYYGQCLPDELPSKLEGAFGLVWDGNELDGCHGNAGEYIRYNNPHKCSLFLSSEIPVIIWEEAALAQFVLDNGVGITIKSLKDIERKLKSISDEEYQNMLMNTRTVAKQLRKGYYFKCALKKIMDREKL